MKELIDSVNKMKEELEKRKSQVAEQIRPQFQQLFLPILNKYPAIRHFKWTQYTPYFNDGEECVFGVGGLYWFLEGKEESYYDNEGEYIYPSHDSDSPLSQEAQAELRILQKSFREIPNEIMRELFGDHAEITINREGIKIEEYSHD